MAAPPPLQEELVEQILVRLPPDDHASLLRAAVVCKLWHRLVSSAAFRRTFREFHRTAAPVLGMLCQFEEDSDSEDDEALLQPTARFVPTSFFRPARAVHRGCRVIDAHHGRVLLQRVPPWPPTLPTSSIDLFVWDPIRDEQRDLPGLPWPDVDPFPWDWNAAVMCRCCRDHHHHLDCASSSFLVVFIEIKNRNMSTSICASESGAWTDVASSTTYHGDLQLQNDYHELRTPGVLVANVLHFMVSQFIDTLSIGVLRYDLDTQQISAIRLPLSRLAYNNAHVLIPMEGGRLGLAAMDKAKLCLYWPTRDDDAQQLELGSDPDRDARLFVLSRVIDLEKLQTVHALSTPINS